MESTSSYRERMVTRSTGRPQTTTPGTSRPGGRVDPTPGSTRSWWRALPAVAALLVGAAAACSPQGQGSSGNTEMAVRTSEARYADTVTTDRIPARGHAWVIFGTDTVVAEVAATPDAHQEGLMHRREVPDGTGMLFVFQSESTRSFWMRDTFVPLDIAFLNQSMEIVDIQQMEPESEEYHTSSAPAMFALEVPEGWFEAHGVEPGDQPEIIFGPR